MRLVKVRFRAVVPRYTRTKKLSVNLPLYYIIYSYNLGACLYRDTKAFVLPIQIIPQLRWRRYLFVSDCIREDIHILECCAQLAELTDVINDPCK